MGLIKDGSSLLQAPPTNCAECRLVGATAQSPLLAFGQPCQQNALL